MKSLVEALKPLVPSALKQPLKRWMGANSWLSPDWHRQAVGGQWDELGQLQFDFLLRQGLLPKHFFLDVGCGSLRGGVHFIRYLEAGHYYGIDKSQQLLDAGRNVELRNAGLIERVPTLLQTDTFEFGALHRQFDFAIAQSVFTHIALNDIVRCMMNMEKALNPGGRFYVTFFENPKGKQHLEPLTHPRTEGPGVVSFFDKDPFHYDFGTFQWICQGTRLRVEYIGEWNHPRGQRMMCFVRM